MVSVLIVAYGDDHAALARAMASVPDGHPVTIVDNGSSVLVRTLAAGAHAAYVDPGANVGFARGVNCGLQSLTETGELQDDVLLLNPDAELGAGCLDRLMGALAQDTSLGCVAPSLLDCQSGKQRVMWPWPTPRRAWREAAGFASSAEDFAVGAVLLIRREALNRVGGFDERFFLYAEEADWQRRATASGWRSAVVSEAVARHEGAGSSTDSQRRECLFHAGQETYIRKWFGTRGWSSYRLAVILGALLRSVVLHGQRGVEARRRAGIYRRGPRRLAGLDSTRS